MGRSQEGVSRHEGGCRTPTLPSLQGAEEPSLVGESIGNHQVLERIGAGGMGVVYLVEHRVLGLRAALKVMRARLASEPEFVRRFIDEGRTCARVRHPNAVQIHDLFALPDGRPAMVLELLDGETLEQRVQSGPLAPGLALPILKQICEALQAAHAAGIVHRDVKADNVLLARRGGAEIVKVLDFGIAKRLFEEGNTRVGAVLGTPDYMAPEQIAGGPLDHRADLYSVGVLAHRILTGRLPFAGGSVVEVLNAHLRSPPPEPTELPEPFRALIRKAMAKSPAERFASAHELGGALGDLEAWWRTCEQAGIGPGQARLSSSILDAPFELMLVQATVELRFASAEAFERLEREQLSKGHLYLPGLLPLGTGGVKVRLLVPGGEAREIEADVVRRFEGELAARWHLPEGVALAVRRAPAGASAREVEMLLELYGGRLGGDERDFLGVRPEAALSEIKGVPAVGVRSREASTPGRPPPRHFREGAGSAIPAMPHDYLRCNVDQAALPRLVWHRAGDRFPASNPASG